MSDLTTKIQGLIDTLNVTLTDAQKADAGNKAATTRVRKSVLAVAKECKNIRVATSSKAATGDAA